MMQATFSHLLAYVLGGVTFLPLLLVFFLGHAYFTLPVRNPTELQTQRIGALSLTEKEKDSADQEIKALPQDFKVRTHEPDVAAGYFAVCREYDSGMSLGKPLDKIPAASTATPESASVYQTMYRSIFERGKPQTPTINGGPKNSKKTRNVFFIVIRLGLLMLYDDSEQLEVRHVISLANYDVDIYGGGEVIPEGELFVKRNCIRMTPKDKQDGNEARPFFLFTTNCSEKEDFYYAMLQNQSRDGPSGLSILRFDDDYMVKLIRQLHASQDNFQTRWLNALLGRIFLSMYKTAVLEQYVRKKINKKLSRVVKPAFISAIQIRNINLGDSAPFFTGPKLRELTRDGDLTLEADVKYKGNARIDVAAVAKIDLGPRFKVREVQLLLAVICKSLEGHMFFRVKPPPSNRIWFTFQTMPKLDLSIEPIVSTRQITYSLILRAIESRLREVIAETLVHPNWDDVPFFNTVNRPIRAGLWQQDSAEALNATVSAEPLPAEGGAATLMQDDDNREESEERVLAEEDMDAAAETPNETPNGSLVNRKKNRANSSKVDSTFETGAWSSSADNFHPSSPRPMRSKSFATAAVPVVSHEQAVVEALKDGNRAGQPDAATGLKDIRSRSQSNTPTDSPVGSPSGPGILSKSKARSMSNASRSVLDSEVSSPKYTTKDAVPKDINTDSAVTDADSASIMSESSANTQKKRQTIVSTAAAAKKWGLEFVARHTPQSSTSSVSTKADPDDGDNFVRSPTLKTSKESLGSRSNPIGRGQPLPPPGQPLPGPRNRTIWTAPLTMLGRKGTGVDTKPANSSTLSVVSTNSAPIDAASNGTNGHSRGNSITVPERNGSNSEQSKRLVSLTNEDQDMDSVLVIKAPEHDLDMDSNKDSTAGETEESPEPSGIFPMSESPTKEILVANLSESTKSPSIESEPPPLPARPAEVHDEEESHEEEYQEEAQDQETQDETAQNEEAQPLECHNDLDFEDKSIPESSPIHPIATSQSLPPLPPTPFAQPPSRLTLIKTPSSSQISYIPRPTDSPTWVQSSSSSTPSPPAVAETRVPTFPTSEYSSTPELLSSPSSSNASSSGMDANFLNLNGQAVRIPRKARSRQSLIPTPTHSTGSRRASPGEWSAESRISSRD